MSNRILKSKTIQPELAYVAEGIREGKSRFQLVDQPGLQKTTLAVGCPSVVQLPGGFVIAVGLSREQVAFLREQFDQILSGSGLKE